MNDIKAPALAKTFVPATTQQKVAERIASDEAISREIGGTQYAAALQKGQAFGLSS